jgi:hypothetical protein
VLHWDGFEWLLFSSGTDKAFRGVFALAHNDVWVVGGDSDQAVAMHWDGTTLENIPTPGKELYSVWGTSTDDLWAVGYQGTILRWNGNQWTPIGGMGTTDFRGVYGSGANDIWAVGLAGAVFHWEGVALQNPITVPAVPVPV